MPRHTGASKFNNGSLTAKARTRKSRKARGRKRQSIKDKQKGVIHDR